MNALIGLIYGINPGAVSSTDKKVFKIRVKAIEVIMFELTIRKCTEQEISFFFNNDIMSNQLSIRLNDMSDDIKELKKNQRVINGLDFNLPTVEGNAGDILQSNGNGTTEWTSMSTGLNVTAKGDLITCDGTELKTIQAGCDGYVLTADSKAENGVEWQPPTSGTSQKLKLLETHLYNFELNNNPIILTNADFANGTYRITSSGHYQLGEDIVFNPNPGNDHFPTQQQISDNDYPIAPLGPYHLGFFAAITVETTNVVINLNGHTLSQSPAHKLQQRFFSLIGLGSSPFVPTQGPSNFGDVQAYPKNVLIKNGVLGASAHHGIHGNNVDGLIVKDLTISGFELAGWAVNGGRNMWFQNITVKDSGSASVLSTYSQARFIRSFLQKIIDDNGPSITIEGISKSGQDILDELQVVMDNVYDVIVNENGVFSQEATDLFVITLTGLDGGNYGGVFNTFGVAVDKFIADRSSLEGGNENILLQNIKIENIQSTPEEIIALSADSNEINYGMNLQKGPVGDVFRILEVTNQDGSYKPNVLANAQIYIAAVGVGAAQRGGTSIDTDVVTWATTNGATSIGGTHYFVCHADSMAHDMKGNIGLFLSGATDVQCEDVSITNIKNLGPLSESEKENGVECTNADEAYHGNESRGIAIVSSKNCSFKKTDVTEIDSTTSNGIPIDFIGENIGISLF